MSATPQIRINDEHIMVTTSDSEFDRRARELLKNELEDEELEASIALYSRVSYIRGNLPEAPSLWTERAWWLLGIVALPVFFYGLYNIGRNLFEFVL